MNMRQDEVKWSLTVNFSKILTLLVGLFSLQNAFGTDNWEVDGENGKLFIFGQMMEGACQLEMVSAWQEVSLGSTARQLLIKPGAQAEPVKFQIKLGRCSRSGGDQSDNYTGTSTEDAIQPIVTLSFTGVSDRQMPSLFGVTGVSGLGLALKDPLNRRIIPGERGEPVMLALGDNILSYTVTPVRTSAPLITGDFHAVVGFEVNYD